MSKKLAIRKLTTIETARLMGLKDEDVINSKAVGVSDSALYKGHGNGIVTNCVSLLMEHLYKSQYDENYEPYDQRFLEAEEL